MGKCRFFVYFWQAVYFSALHGFKKIDMGKLVLGEERLNCAGIFKQSMGARNRVEKGLSYRSARLHRLSELIP